MAKDKENVTVICFSADHDKFTQEVLPLYTGPRVIVRMTPSNREFKLSKELLCRQSPYFKAAFEGGFQESKNQEILMVEMDGVLSVRSFEFLVQWLYTAKVIFDNLDPTATITDIIGLVRTADFFGISGLEDVMAKAIRNIITRNNRVTQCITPDHIASAYKWHSKHPICLVLAEAAVPGFFNGENRRFLDATEQIPSFASNLLRLTSKALSTVHNDDGELAFVDPIDDELYCWIPQEED